MLTLVSYMSGAHRSAALRVCGCGVKLTAAQQSVGRGTQCFLCSHLSCQLSDCTWLTFMSTAHKPKDTILTNVSVSFHQRWRICSWLVLRLRGATLFANHPFGRPNKSVRAPLQWWSVSADTGPHLTVNLLLLFIPHTHSEHHSAHREAAGKWSAGGK